MPQIVIEYSNNVEQSRAIKDTFRDVKSALVHGLPTRLANCKARAVRREEYSIGDNDNNGVVHMEIAVLPGRANTALKALARKLQVTLERSFKCESGGKLLVSVEIRELSEAYSKN